MTDHDSNPLSPKRRQMLVGAGLAALAGAGLSPLAMAAGADDKWPERAVRLIVPFPPGGGSDTVARLVATALADRLGQPVVVENKAGGTGTVGVAYGLQAPADGYTLIWCTPAAQYLAPKSVRYDPVNDFAPVSMTVAATYILMVNPSLPIHSVADLIAAAKARPDGINYATSGTGGQGHLMGEYFNQLAGTRMTQVPYAGEGPAVIGLMGNQVHAAFISSAAALRQVKAGKLRAIGMSSATRLPGIPEDIAPIADTLPGYDVTAINYLSMRNGTPESIVHRLSKHINEILVMPSVRDKIAGMGVVPVGSTPKELKVRVLAERAKWITVMEKANIVLE
ncbi:MAG: tripartite tricarboxylate transporter substrate binding protein [Rhodoferax sp.]|jgi:tripartite-type tricarboxylate transporter receptor subunit TctC|nr:tripartite tricarboxylate transporter substrate binding protein [Rhodoferax sp.]